jgi:hypothetical protein
MTMKRGPGLPFEQEKLFFPFQTFLGALCAFARGSSFLDACNYLA